MTVAVQQSPVTSSTVAGDPGALRRALRVEHQIVWIRWFGSLAGILIVSLPFRAFPGDPVQTWPPGIRLAGYALFLALALENFVALAVMRRIRTEQAVHRLGVALFIVDAVLLLSITGAFSFGPIATSWATLCILPLEAALRFGLRGGMIAAIAALPLEIGREVYRNLAYGYEPNPQDVIFRTAVIAVVASIAGILAGSLRDERALARAQATRAEETALREATARTELQAFHDVMIAGIAAPSLSEAMDHIVEAMRRSMGYEAFGLALVEGSGRNRHLRCVGAFGHPPGSVGRTIPLDRGICGFVASTGRAEVVADTAADRRYEEWVPGIRSEMAAPILDRDEVIGIVDVESSRLDAFSREDGERLSRLTSQIGLVITNAKLLEQERETVRRMRELDEMKADFVSVVSHELRTPLTSLQGFLKTLRRPELALPPEEVEQCLEVMDRQADRLGLLVEDLLLVTRIDEGPLKLSIVTADPLRAVGSIIEELGPHAAARVHIRSDNAPRHLVTDPERLGQIVRRLVDNALRFSPPDTDVDMVLSQSGRSLNIDIADRGDGIPPSELERIFAPFQQIGGMRRHRNSGAGLGLYISRWLAQGLGGSLEAWSTPGRGSTFRISVPIGDPLEETSQTA